MSYESIYISDHNLTDHATDISTDISTNNSTNNNSNNISNHDIISTADDSIGGNFVKQDNFETNKSTTVYSAYKGQIPDGVANLLTTDFNVQSKLMVHVGKLFSNSLHKTNDFQLKHVACKALMAMKVRPSQKSNFIKYTAAFADYAFSHDDHGDHGDYDTTIEKWWTFARMHESPTPYDWFEKTEPLGPQLVGITMCAITMIQVNV